MEPQDEQRTWLLQVLERTKLAPTALAIRANLAPTTLTRFLNKSDHASALSARTISAVEKVAGIRFQGSSEVAAVENKAPEAKIFLPQSGGLEETLVKAALCLEGVSAWELSSRALETAGYLPGDVLIVDANRPPQPGSIVAVDLLDWEGRRWATVFRLFEPPALIAATMDPQLRRPMFQDKDHRVAGVVVGSLRVPEKAHNGRASAGRVVYL
jgi:hypothetical protein